MFSAILSRNLADVKSKFCVPSKPVVRLKTVGMHLCNELNILKDTKNELLQLQGEVAEKSIKIIKCRIFKSV